jgi:hypothetical protein
MRRSRDRKLQVRRETVRVLAEVELRRVAGGESQAACTQLLAEQPESQAGCTQVTVPPKS